MKKQNLLLTLLFTICFPLIMSAQDQSTAFVAHFGPKADLKKIFASGSERLVSFDLSGVISEPMAVTMKQSMSTFSIKVLEVTISELKGDMRAVTIRLSADASLAFFTKLLITSEIRQVKAGNTLMRTEELND